MGLQPPPLKQVGQGQTVAASRPANGYRKKQLGMRMLRQPRLQTDVSTQHWNSCDRRWQFALVDDGDNLDLGAMQSLVEHLGLSCRSPKNDFSHA
jgi:hypothetical protein